MSSTASVDNSDIMSAINERNKLDKEFIEEKSPDSKIEKYRTCKAKRNLSTEKG